MQPSKSETDATAPMIQMAVIIASLLLHQSALGCCQKLCPALLAESTKIEIGITPLAPNSPFA